MPFVAASPRPARRWPRRAAVVLLVFLGVLTAAPAWAQDDEFPGLDPGRRVYDRTGSSLTAEQAGRLTARLVALRDSGADAVVLVRALDADSDDTYDQTEALQQAWAATTRTGQDTAVAILVNRNPDDPTDARAGIFVGRTYQDGNVPEKEQRAIVEDALIPPLRTGDVNGALTAAVDRLDTSIRNGPPVSAFDRWAADQAGSWLPGTAIGVAVIALGGALLLFGRRSRYTGPTPEPTTRRPGELSPAVVEKLVTGSSTARSLQALVLALAARDALAIEPDDTGGKPTVRIRLRDRQQVEGPVEEAVWAELAERADDRVVDRKALRAAAGHTAPLTSAVRRRLLDEGWLDAAAGPNRIRLAAIGALTLVAGVFAVVIAAAGGGSPLAWVGAAALVLVGVSAIVLAAAYPPLSAAGLKVAAQWKAYRDGLRAAAKDGSAELDLDRALPDVVALGLAPAMKDRLAAATGSLSAFGAATAEPAAFPLWTAFIDATASAAGSGAGTVSGAGAGGGGGAAGST